MPSTLGPHAIATTEAVLSWARVAGIVKSIDNLDVLRAAPGVAIKVHRHYFANQDLGASPTTVALELLQSLGGYRDPNLYVEIYNEIPPEQLVPYADLLAKVVPILHSAGLKVAGFSFSTGTPELEDWLYLQGRGWCGVDAIALHEYWGNVGFTGWFALRYRKAHGWTGGNHPPFLVTECGRDAVEGGQGGWQKDGLNVGQYLGELAAYANELAKDSYVLGATVFTGHSPDPQWQPYEIDPLCAQAAQMFAGQAGPIKRSPMFDYQSPNHDGDRQITQGVVIHSTRGGASTLDAEFKATVSWFNNPQSQVSAHAVVGDGVIYRPVPARLVAWHARSYNETHLGIELVQPNHGDAIPESVYDLAAKEVASWCLQYRFPLVWDIQRGLAEHWEIPPGIADGKTDIQTPFDREKFLALVKHYAGEDEQLSPEQKQTITDALNQMWGDKLLIEQAAAEYHDQNLANAAKGFEERIVAIKQAAGIA